MPRLPSRAAAVGLAVALLATGGDAALAATTAPSPHPSGSAQASPPATPPPSGYLSPAYPGLAELARSSGQPQLIGDQTSQTTQEWAMPDGSILRESALVPVRTRTPAGWVDVDLRLATNDGWAAPIAAAAAVAMNTSAPAVRLVAAGSSVTLSSHLPTGGGVVDGTRVAYGTDPAQVSARAGPTAVTLDSPVARGERRWSFDLAVSGATLTDSDTGVDIVGVDGTVVATVPDTVVRTGAAPGDDLSGNVVVARTDLDGAGRLILHTDVPITDDGRLRVSLWDDAYRVGATSLLSSAPDADLRGQGALAAGRLDDGSDSRVAAVLATRDAAPASAVRHAELRLFRTTPSPRCDDLPALGVPAVGAALAAACAGQWTSWDVTRLAQVGAADQELVISGGRHATAFAMGDDPQQAPRIVTTYDDLPTLVAAPQPSPRSVSGGTTWVPTPRPSFTATAVAPWAGEAPGQLVIRFVVQHVGTKAGATAATGTSSAVTNSQPATWTPTKNLPDGRYVVRAQAVDLRGRVSPEQAPLATSTAFSIDHRAPQQPLVNSPAYGTGTTTAAGNPNASFAWSHARGVAVSSYLIRRDAGPWIPTTATSIQWYPGTPGTHSLTVRAVGVNGRSSAPRTYRFAGRIKAFYDNGDGRSPISESLVRLLRAARPGSHVKIAMSYVSGFDEAAPPGTRNPVRRIIDAIAAARRQRHVRFDIIVDGSARNQPGSTRALRRAASPDGIAAHAPVSTCKRGCLADSAGIMHQKFVTFSALAAPYSARNAVFQSSANWSLGMLSNRNDASLFLDVPKLFDAYTHHWQIMRTCSTPGNGNGRCRLPDRDWNPASTTFGTSTYFLPKPQGRQSPVAAALDKVGLRRDGRSRCGKGAVILGAVNELDRPAARAILGALDRCSGPSRRIHFWFPAPGSKGMARAIGMIRNRYPAKATCVAGVHTKSLVVNAPLRSDQAHRVLYLGSTPWTHVAAAGADNTFVQVRRSPPSWWQDHARWLASFRKAQPVSCG